MLHMEAHNRAKKVDLYKAFFKFKANRHIVLDAFSKMESYYLQYDADGNRKFSLQVHKYVSASSFSARVYRRLVISRPCTQIEGGLIRTHRNSIPSCPVTCPSFSRRRKQPP